MYTTAASSVSIETTDGPDTVEITAVEKKETGTSVYSGLFVTGGTMEDERNDITRRSKIKTENDLFKACGSRELRKFGAEGKKARYEL